MTDGASIRVVYLAGPEVFLDPDTMAAVREAKLRACADRGVEGLFPTDADPGDGGTERPGPEQAASLFDALRADLDRCDAGIANLTPFRGPSADAGTIWEVGYLTGQGKPVAGYTNMAQHYRDRAAGSDAFLVEDFALTDNLMIDRGVRWSSGIEVVRTDVAQGRELLDLGGFVAALDALLGRRSTVSRPTAGGDT